MAGLIGNLSGFDGNSETWTSYEERLEQYFLVNEIDGDKKVPALLTLLGEKTYGLLRSLTSPDKPSTKSYDELCALLNRHLSPKPLIIAERFRFHKRNQGVSEGVTDYVASLRKLAEHCEFKDNLNDTLRDRLVCGLKNEQIQRRLLSTEDLTLKKAIDTAIAMETASKDAAELQSLTSNVNKIEKKKFQYKLKQKSGNSSPAVKPCIHCGKNNHASFKCRFKNAVCHGCNGKGHIKSICLKSRGVNTVNDEDPVMIINTVKRSSSKKIIITPEVDGVPVEMEVDTGSAVSLMSREIFQKCFGKVTLDKPTSVLKTYSGEELQQAGTKMVRVYYNGQTELLKLCVVMGNGPTLFGREWMTKITLDWNSIVHVNSIDDQTTQKRLGDIMQRYATVFSDGIGKVVGIRATLSVKENATPKFVKARPVPYSLKPKIENELDSLEKQGIITKVKTSEWATPIVPVVKPSGAVRICGDFKVTVNQAINVDKYPLPRIEDIFANLSNGHKYSKLDLRQAYLQLECDDSTKQMLTINTHKGLYSYNRLTYGVSAAPAIWQRTIEQILQGLPGVQCILDDMVITGKNDQIHLDNLENVVQRLSQYGLKVNKEKCQFFQERISYCGHEIDENGLWKCKDKVDSIVNTPPPQNVTSLRAYLGLLNYYHRFLNDLATVIKPLNQLLEKGRKFVWSKQCQDAFAKSKVLITSEPVLTHYDPELPVRLATDASPFGISAIMSHVMLDGSEKPIAYASRSLSKPERMYAQIQREATAIYWAVRKYYPYLYGRKFTLITDCQALLSIFSPSKGIPATSAARIQRYAVYLSGFDYDIQYKSTTKHTNVDGMSRLPAPSFSENEMNFEEVFFNEQFDKLPVTSAQIKRETQHEPVLSRVYENVNKGWNNDVNDPRLKGYHTRRNELTIQRGCLMWGIRVVIPSKLRERVLELLHCSHGGIVKMKNLARSYVWWPGIDSDIELMVKQCQGCQMQQKSPAKVQLHPWENARTNFERVHVDFVGPFQGRMFLVIICARSKWAEIEDMGNCTTADKTIQVLRTIFSRYGLPKQLVSDNGVQFTSDAFAQFMKNNGVFHIRTAVAKPSTNGLVERLNGTFKSSIRAMKFDKGDLNLKLSNFLLTYRNSIHQSTQESPAMMFFGRSLRNRLDLLKPDTDGYVEKQRMKLATSESRKFREFEIGDTVIARDYRPTATEKWLPGTILSREGPLMYKIDIGNNQVWRRHVDQLRKSEFTVQSQYRENESSTLNPVTPTLSTFPDKHMGNNPLVEISNQEKLPTSENNERNESSSRSDDITMERRYPVRDRKPPDRLSY